MVDDPDLPGNGPIDDDAVDRPRRGKSRRRRKIIITALVVLAVLSGTVAWLLGTQSGLGVAWSLVAPHLPAQVQMISLEGRLAGPIVIKNLIVDTDTQHIEIDRTEVVWDPLRLLSGVADFTRVSLSGIDISPREGKPDVQPEDTAPFALPDSIALPVAVELHHVALSNVAWHSTPDAAPVVIDSVSLNARLDDDKWVVNDIAVQASDFEISGQLSVVPHDAYASTGQLDWTIRPEGYPEAHGQTTLTGTINQLTLRQTIAAPYQLTANVTVMDPLARGAIDGQLTTKIEPAALGLDVPVTSVMGTLTVDGSIEQIQLRAKAEIRSTELTDLDVNLDGAYSDGLARINTLQISEPGSKARVELAGQLAFETEPQFKLDGTWQDLAWPANGEPTVVSKKGELHVAGTLEDLTVQTVASLGAKGNLRGKLRLREEQVNGNLRWQELAWPMNSPEVASKQGTLDIEGTLDAYRLALDTQLRVKSGPEGRIQAAGNGTSQGLVVSSLTAKVLAGTITGQAHVQWSPTLDLNADLAASNLNSGIVDAQWPGQLDGRIKVAASLNNGNLEASVDPLTIQGKLRNRAVEVNARGRYASDTLQLDQLTLHSGQSTAQASGTLGELADLDWQIASPDLADLCPGCSGELMAEGHIKGPRTRPQVTVVAKGMNIAAPSIKAELVDVSADIDLSGIKASHLELEVKQATVASADIATLKIEGSGNAASHTLSLSADTQYGSATVGLEGQFEQPWTQKVVWHFELDKGTLAYPELEPWVMQGVTSGLVARNAVELTRSCWRSADAQACLTADTAKDGNTHASVSLTDLPFGYFVPLLPDGVAVSGQISAKADVELTDDGLQKINASFDTTAGEIARAIPGDQTGARQTDTQSPDQSDGFEFGAGTGRLSSDGNRMTLAVDWPFEDEGKLEIDGTLARQRGESFAAAVLDGKAIATVKDLSFLDAVSDQINDPGGLLEANVKLSGTVGAPMVTGRVAIEDMHADLVAPGITVRNFNLLLTGDGVGDINVEARAESGGGSMHAQGALSLTGPLPVGTLELTGNNFKVLDTSLGQVFVSPQLSLDAKMDRLTLTGKVVVPKARLTPQTLPEGAVSVSSDQVIVGNEGQPQSSTLVRPLYAQIRLILGDDVTIKGMGLQAMLGGEVKIIENPTQPTTGSGELRIEKGTYTAYGQDLQIRTGRLIFAGGPLANPGLDVVAVRQATEDILVGARVRGTLLQPTLSLFSEPPLPKQEQLAYLVLGRPLNNASSSESSALTSAALALGIKGGNFVSEKLNKELGFEQFGIETEPGAKATSAAFVIGRYLTPSLYVSYGIGLFEPVNTLKLRYTISSNWKLVTETSSEAKGADLLYHIELGK